MERIAARRRAHFFCIGTCVAIIGSFAHIIRYLDGKCAYNAYNHASLQ
jgi:hypothetical protein